MIAPGVLQQAAKEIADLVQKKNAAYGDSFEKSGEILKILMPNGCPPEKFQDMLTVARITDKLFRICTDPTAFNEDPWKDIMGYALLSVASRSCPTCQVPGNWIHLEGQGQCGDCGRQVIRQQEA